MPLLAAMERESQVGLAKRFRLRTELTLISSPASPCGKTHSGHLAVVEDSDAATDN